MRAWQFTGVGEPLKLVEVADPIAGEGEIVIKVRASGLCHSDVGFMDGTLTALLGHVPIILGHEIAGTVCQVGPGVKDLELGQRVGVPALVWSPGTARDGGFADMVAVSADLCVPLPDAVAFEQAAPAMDAARTAYRGVVTAGQVREGMTIGIIGFGGLGGYAVQIAKALGAKVYVAEVNRSSWETATKMGVESVAEDIREFGDKNLDVIVDFAGFGTTTASAIDAIRPRGRVVQVGLGTEMATISAQKVTMKEITYLGCSNGEKEEVSAVLEMMGGGKIKSEIIPISFEEIPTSLSKLEHGGVRGRFVALMPGD